MPEQWTSSLTTKSRRFKEGRRGTEKLWTPDSHVGGEIGVKTIVYNMKRDQKKRREKNQEKEKEREREREREKGWRNTIVKRKNFVLLITLLGPDRGYFLYLYICNFFLLINTIDQYLFPRFRLTSSPTLYKFIVWAFWAWVHSYFGFKPKPVLTIIYNLFSKIFI